MGLNKDFKDLVKDAERQGWTVVRGRAGHLKWYPPSGEGWVTSAQTPSDYRAIENVKAWLRRKGWVDPTRQPKKVRPKVVADELPPCRKADTEEGRVEIPWDLYLHLTWTPTRLHDYTTTQPQEEKAMAEIAYRLAPEGPPAPQAGRPIGGGSKWGELLDELAETASGIWVQLEGEYSTNSTHAVRVAGKNRGYLVEASTRNTHPVEDGKGRVGTLWVKVTKPTATIGTLDGLHFVEATPPGEATGFVGATQPSLSS